MDHSKDKLIKKIQHKNELQARELQYKDKVLAEIHKLWQARENQDKLSRTDNAAFMHRLELLDDIIHIPIHLHNTTSFSCKHFDYILKQFTKKQDDMEEG